MASTQMSHQKVTLRNQELPLEKSEKSEKSDLFKRTIRPLAVFSAGGGWVIHADIEIVNTATNQTSAPWLANGNNALGKASGKPNSRTFNKIAKLTESFTASMASCPFTLLQSDPTKKMAEKGGAKNTNRVCTKTNKFTLDTSASRMAVIIDRIKINPPTDRPTRTSSSSDARGRKNTR